MIEITEDERNKAELDLLEYHLKAIRVNILRHKWQKHKYVVIGLRIEEKRLMYQIKVLTTQIKSSII